MSVKRRDFSGANKRVAGDTWTFEDLAFVLTSGSLQDADCSVTMELRRYRGSASIATVAGTVTGPTAASFSFDADTQTALITAGRIWYEIKVAFSASAERYTVWEGEIEVGEWPP